MSLPQQSPMPFFLALSAAALLAASPQARADQWRDQTVLTFATPTMIPGTTLEPGTYVFELVDVEGLRHHVEVSDARDVIVAVPQAVPVKRGAPSRTRTTFAAVEPGLQALKAWFYPKSAYGHEFVYPEAQAAFIAEHASTPVLAVDTWDDALDAGTLHLVQPSGSHAEWRADVDTSGDWEAWTEERALAPRGDR